MKFTFKTEIIPIIIILISVILSGYFYSVFPDQVPIHWNFQGEVDNWGSKFMGAFLMPLMAIGMYLLFLILPLIDPKKDKYKQFNKVYLLFRNLIILMLFAIYIISSLNALGYKIRVEVWIPFLIGILFIVMGNYFGKIKPNWFMGIRTPWTLSSDEVWLKTHRLGGKLSMALGFLLIISPSLPHQSLLFTLIIPIMIVVMVPVIYSYILFKNK